MIDNWLKNKWDNKNVLDYAREEGRELGRQEGREEERERAREERKRMAREMKNAGFSLEKIIRLIKLSPEEIEKL